MYRRAVCAIFALFAVAFASAANAQVIAEDDFEQGSWKSFWGSRRSVTISTEQPRSGVRSARFEFEAEPPGGDSFSELRFDLGREYRELTIEFDLYIPPNYFHRPESPNNNKFFRLWLNDYDDVEKLGASLLSQGTSGESRIGTDYSKEAHRSISTGVKNAPDFITASDKGKWTAIRIYVKAASDAENGIIRIYKNGQLFLNDTGLRNHIPGTQGYRHGYLLGWANSGFAQETVFYIDNVRFLAGDAAKPAPKPPHLTVK